MEVVEGKVGKKGEIYVKKRLRELLDLKPGDRVEFVITDRGVIFRKKKSALDLLETKVAKVDVDEVLALREEFEREMERD